VKTAELVSKYRHSFNTDFTADVNCAGAWLFTEGSGTQVDDASANSNVGDFKGAGEPAWANMSGTGAPTYASKMVDFDGSNDFISIPSITEGTAFSVTSWIFPNSVSSYCDFFSHASLWGNPGWIFQLRVTSGLLVYRVYYYDYNSGVAVTLSQWNHVAFSISSTDQLIFYLDGVATNAVTAGKVPSTNVIYLGKSENSDWSYWLNGNMSESSLFTDVLTSTEINEIMDYGLKPTTVTNRLFALLGVGN
jgi:hypothetical protein